MPKRKVIGIDLDDVLLDFNRALCTYHNERYEPKYTWENIRSFYLEETWKCSREEVRERVFKFYVTNDHARALPVPGAQEAIKKISTIHDCIVITSRPESIKELTLFWCDQYFPQAFKKIYFTNQFHRDLSFPAKNKGEICRELGIEIYIEEAPHHALDVANAGIPVLLYDVPWNRAMESHPLITRAYSWDDILKKLMKSL